jgi:hypothetical protein
LFLFAILEYLLAARADSSVKTRDNSCSREVKGGARAKRENRMVCLVYLVCLVEGNLPGKPNQPDEQNKPNEPSV